MRAKYHYKITIDPLHPTQEGQKPEQTLSFETYNHDNVLAVGRRLCKKTHFDDKTATSFAIGLKLMTEVMLENRDDPLFSELKPAMVDFMKKLKTQMRGLTPEQEVAVSQEASANEHSSEAQVLDDMPAEHISEEVLAEEGRVAADHVFAQEEISKEDPQADEMSTEEFVVGDFSRQDVSIGEGDDVEEIVLDEGLASEFASDESLDEFLQSMEKNSARSLAQRDTLEAPEAKDPPQAQKSKRPEVKYELVEKINKDGVLEGLELVEVEESA